MAVESKRGCGYRKVGGLYLVGGGIGVPCDRLPLLLDVCPTCSHGIKPSRGWTWVDVNALVQGGHYEPPSRKEEKYLCDCAQKRGCSFCGRPETMGRAGLLWVGESFYKTPEEFIVEGVALGFSRRIRAIPRGFKVGETYVLLAHPKAIRDFTPIEPKEDELIGATELKFRPGVFYIWLPQRLEKIYPQSLHNSDQVEEDMKRGITPVFVPDDDPDHQGNVFEDAKKEKTLFEEAK